VSAFILVETGLKGGVIMQLRGRRARLTATLLAAGLALIIIVTSWVTIARPTDDLQPALPLRATFYYPWFPEAWNQKGINPYINYHPTDGFYDSSDPAAIRRHIDSMQYAGIQAGIASWWGRGSRTDQRLPTLLAAAAGSPFRWTVYYELEGQGDPSVSQLTADLIYLRDHYGADPTYLRIDGRFVVFVYADAADGCGMIDRWNQANVVNAYIVLKVFVGYQQCAHQPDGWHQYAPAVAASTQGKYSYTISPGFSKVGEAARLTRDLARWKDNIRAMVASGAAFQLVTTFNEWGEGTSVESASEWASPSGYGAFLDALHSNGRDAPTPTATSSAIPNPTVMPTTMPNTQDTPPSPTAAPVLVGAGDIASCASTGDEATAALLASINGTVVTLGDNVYDSGAPSEFANCFDPTWGRSKERIRPAIGNHDYLTPGAAGYFGYFGATAGDPTKGYYSYDVGSWHIVALNSNCSQAGGCGAGSPQEQWLRTDLAAHPTACTLAYWHHPRFSSGEHGSFVTMQPIWQTLYDAGADVVLNGHDHDYERFAPQDPTGTADPTRGIREFVVGTGGKNHYGFNAPIANSEVRNDKTFGVLKLTLHANSYDWTFVPEAGKSFSDSGSTACH
jgi:hypothetical protein